MIKPFFVITASLFFYLNPIFVLLAQESSSSFELGYLGANRLAQNFPSTRTRFFLWNENQKNVEFANGNQFKIKSQIRFQIDEKPSLVLRQLKATFLSNILAFNLGFLDIPWGETFGFFIADLVNPRDFTDPLFNDARWTKLPVFALHPQVKIFSHLSAELVWLPFPKQPILPGELNFSNSLKLVPTSDFEWSTDLNQIRNQMEYGGRLGGLLAGIDWHVFYLKHWNRNFAFELQMDTSTLIPSFQLAAVKKMVDSWGGTFSKAFEDWVLRVDVVRNAGQPWTAATLSKALEINQWQAIVGADFNWGSHLNLAGQFHFDRYELPTQTNHFYWLSTRAQYQFDFRNWEAEIFWLQGLGHQDQWVQAKLTMPWLDNVSLSLRLDGVWSAEQKDGAFVGYLAPFKSSHRLLYELRVFL